MGDISSKIEKASWIDFDSRIKAAKIAPRNVLPVSPIKILDGNQFFSKNAKNPKKSGRKKIFNLIDKIRKMNENIPQIKPSIPSIKFTKFTRPLINIMIPI